MINHLGSQLEGTAREWWTSKLRFDRAREGRLFNDWQFFTKRLAEQFNPWNARMEAYNKLLALRLTSDAPGAATRHVEQFRDLEDMDLQPYQQHMDSDHEEEQDDDDDEGNVSGVMH